MSLHPVLDGSPLWIGHPELSPPSLSGDEPGTSSHDKGCMLLGRAYAHRKKVSTLFRVTSGTCLFLSLDETLAVFSLDSPRPNALLKQQNIWQTWDYASSPVPFSVPDFPGTAGDLGV